MAVLAPPSREVLQQLDDEARQAYARACLDPTATERRKQAAFEQALGSLAMLLDHDRHAK